MKFMLSLLHGFAALVALLVFAHLASASSGRVLEPLFELANGDSSVLSFMLCGFLLLVMVTAWLWSSAGQPRRHG